MKAIHNSFWSIRSQAGAVISLGRYHFESNSQRIQNNNIILCSCDFLRKIPF
nr:hypothetical protein [Cecembia calidifontis]